MNNENFSFKTQFFQQKQNSQFLVEKSYYFIRLLHQIYYNLVIKQILEFLRLVEPYGLRTELEAHTNSPTRGVEGSYPLQEINLRRFFCQTFALVAFVRASSAQAVRSTIYQENLKYTSTVTNTFNGNWASVTIILTAKSAK